MAPRWSNNNTAKEIVRQASRDLDSMLQVSLVATCFKSGFVYNLMLTNTDESAQTLSNKPQWQLLNDTVHLQLLFCP